MKKAISFLVLIVSVAVSVAQQKPKLVVGIVVDQMRMDYIYRYWDKFGEDGFKKLMDEGFTCKNAHFNYIPTYTGPGHASVYSGATPMNHGIIANDWFEKQSGNMVYCVEDAGVNAVGTESDAGKMSPHRMLAQTIGDAIRISNNFNGKSIGISIKDRGAILPAGHAANAAFWMDYQSGHFVSSTYYMESLPNWLKSFNSKDLPNSLSADGWSPLLAMDQYSASTADDTPYEKVYTSSGKPVFPYNISAQIQANSYYAFAATPFGNTILRMLAEQVIVEEDLGDDEHTDFLSISFSSTDMVGHAFGPQSIEIEDTYLRLDADIALLLKALDKRIGENNYTLFLTADHGAAQVPSYMKDHNMPVDYFNQDTFVEGIENHLQGNLGAGSWISSFSNQQIFLNHQLMKTNQIDEKKIFDLIEEFALDFEGVAGVHTTRSLRHPLPEDQFALAARKGWNQKRSGDVMLQLLPGWMIYSPQGTTHGSSYNYDTHVPLIFFGKGVAEGVSYDEIEITRIAPTISMLSSIAFPSQSDHRVINEVIDFKENQD